MKSFVLSLSFLLLSLFCHSSYSATLFTVGDSSGWAIPPYPSFYTNWSQSQFMKIGDSLEFNFDPRFYNLVQVSEYEYEHCTSFNAVKLLNSSPAIVALNETGIFFFVCNISNYCCLGQKIAIIVHDSPSPSPSPSPTPIPQHGLCCNGTGATPSSSPPSGSSISSMPSPSGNGNGGHSPEPSTSVVDKSMATTLVQVINFSLSLKNLFMFGLLGFLVI